MMDKELRMKNENNIEKKKIKINDIEIPLLVTMNKIKEPYRTIFLGEAIHSINGTAQSIWNNRDQDQVKNIKEISANVKCYTYGINQMTGAIDNINIMLELFDGKQKVINTNCGFTLRY